MTEGKQVGGGLPKRRTLTSGFLRVVGFVVITALLSVLAFRAADVYSSHRSKDIKNALCLCGISSMTESQLQKTIVSNHLIVYWAGPQDNMEYLLDASDRSAIVLTMLPADRPPNGIGAAYSRITTYVQTKAFQSVLSGGGNSHGSAFINSDGNSVFYTSSDLENVFIGIRGKDVELQISNSTPGESLVIARQPRVLRPIT